MIRIICKFAVVLSVFLCAATARGGITTAVFDFENHAVTSNGGLTSLAMTKNGIGLTIDRVGQPFDIGSLSPFSGATAFGGRSLAPTPPGGNFFNINFSQPITQFSAQLGDFTGTTTDLLALTAFSGRNGTGSNLGTTFATLPLNPNGVFAFTTLGLNGQAIGSVQLIGGTFGSRNSVYFDNFHVTANGGNSTVGGVSAAPLPAALCVMPFCAAIAWSAARKLRSRPKSQSPSSDGPVRAIRRRLQSRRQYTQPLYARTTRGWDRPHLGDL